MRTDLPRRTLQVPTRYEPIRPILIPRNFVSNWGELSLRSGLFMNSQKTR